VGQKVSVVYLIPPRTLVAVSIDGSEYKVQASPQLQFTQSPEIDETHAVFVRGKKRIRVARADVIVSRYNGQGGSNQFAI